MYNILNTLLHDNKINYYFIWIGQSMFVGAWVGGTTHVCYNGFEWSYMVIGQIIMIAYAVSLWPRFIRSSNIVIQMQIDEEFAQYLK